MCDGDGYILFTGEDGNEYAKECSCGKVEKERQEAKLRFAAIPEAYKNVSLNDISYEYYTKRESRECFERVAKTIKWYLENLEQNVEEGKGLYFWSKVKGSGKTMVTTALSNELINKHRRFVKFATSLDILDEIRASYDSESEESESKLLNDLTTADFLVIDDFGTEKVSEWVFTRFYQIVNRRYINKKVTFFTSNYDLETLKYDERVTNRIKERSFVVHFPEESAREHKAVLENKIEFD